MKIIIKNCNVSFCFQVKYSVSTIYSSFSDLFCKINENNSNVLTPIDDNTDTLECLLILLCILWVLMNLINFGPNLKG